jgi:RND family efflux transporter MFP subunit
MYFIALALAALALACSDSSSSAQANAVARIPGGPPGKQGAPPALVELAAAQGGSLTDTWSFLGRAEAAQSAELAAAVSGHVLAVKVREGARVKKNQVLLTLDSAKIRAELVAARAREQGLVAELELAERQLERVSKLEYPTISEPERERFQLNASNVRAQLAVQRADIQRLQVESSRHTIQAPFAGVISARHVDPGAWVNVGQAVLGLISLDDLEVHVDVSAELGSRLEVGQSATLAGPTTADAEIAGIVGALDTDTRTMRVRLVPRETPVWLLSGMAVDVQFAVTLDGQGVLVPRDAVIRGPVSARVIKAVDGQAVPIDVNVVAATEDRILVSGELAAGDQVVIRGNERLRPGQPLQIKNPGQKNGPAAGPAAPAADPDQKADLDEKAGPGQGKE